MMDCLALKLDSDVLKDNYKCEITESLVILDKDVCIKMYGLNMYNRNPFLANQQGEYCRVDAISDDLDEVIRIRELIRELDVYPVHLKDIIEDMMC